MNQQQMRAIALGSARAILRLQGQDSVKCSAEKALIILDDESRREPESLASRWYLNASDHQLVLFACEWRAWAEEHLDPADDRAIVQGQRALGRII